MKKSTVLFTTALFSSITLMGCAKTDKTTTQATVTQEVETRVSNSTAAASDEIHVKNVTLHTYVGDSGQMVDGVIYELDNIFNRGDMKSGDFSITMENDTFKVLDITKENNTLNLKVEPFRYLGKDVYDADMKGTHYDFSIDCTVDNLDFQKGDDCTIETKTADDFVMGIFTGSNDIELPYWIYLPENASNLPLLLWEHGGGEVLSSSYEGANIKNNRGAVTWIENGYDTAVLSFQFPENYDFGISENPEQLKIMQDYNDVIYEFIQEMIQKGQIDPQRVYICGASSGGGAALRFLMQYPDLFAAALPICAKDTLISISKPYELAYKFKGSLEISDEDYQKCYQEISDLMKDNNITNIPIWFVQAENDPVCTSYTSKILYSVLNDMGAVNNKLTLYTDEEMKEAGQTIYHFSWVPVLQDKEMMDWLYSQSK